MNDIISVTGYAPKIRVCPRCGSENIDFTFTGSIVCGECGLEAYIVEGDNSKDYDV